MKEQVTMKFPIVSNLRVCYNGENITVNRKEKEFEMKHQIRRRIVPFALAAVLGIQPVMAAPYRLSVPSGYTSPFVDVQSGDWYYKYVAVLNSQGMIDGYGDGQFGAQ